MVSVMETILCCYHVSTIQMNLYMYRDRRPAAATPSKGQYCKTLRIFFSNNDSFRTLVIIISGCYILWHSLQSIIYYRLSYTKYTLYNWLLTNKKCINSRHFSTPSRVLLILIITLVEQSVRQSPPTRAGSSNRYSRLVNQKQCFFIDKNLLYKCSQSYETGL